MGILDRIRENREYKKRKADETARLNASVARQNEIAEMNKYKDMPKQYRKKFKDTLNMVEKECAKIAAGHSSNITPENLKPHFEVPETFTGVYIPDEPGALPERVKFLKEFRASVEYASNEYSKVVKEGKAAYEKALNMLKLARQKAEAKKKEDKQQKKAQEEQDKKDQEAKKKSEEEKRKAEEEQKRKAEEKKKEKEEEAEQKEILKEPTFEEMRAKALEDVERYVGNDTHNISTIFYSSAGSQYLDDPALVCEIIEKYPQSIKNLPNDFVANNLDAVTDSFVEGTEDICDNLLEARYETRFYGGAGPSYVNYTENGIPMGNYYQDRDRLSSMQDIADVYCDKMNSLCEEAMPIIEELKESGDEKYSAVDTQKMHVGRIPIQIEEKVENKEFEAKVGDAKDKAKIAASVISGEIQL